MSQDQAEQPSEEVAKPEDDGFASSGEQLKTARLAHDFSIDDVSARLKLSVKKIESFERGDIDGIATPVFVAGYLRAYARLVGLSEDDVLSGFGMSSTKQSAVDEMALGNAELESKDSKSESVIYRDSSTIEGTSRNSVSLVMAIVMSLLVIAVVYFSLLDDEPTEVSHVASNSAEDSSKKVAGPALGVTSGMVSEESVSAEMPIAENKDVAVEEKLADEVQTETGLAEVAQEIAEVFHQSELSLVFNDESWVEVTDARGERLVYRLAKAGMSRTVMGVAPFVVQLGYVPGVEIFYNGAPYDLSHFTGRRSARFRVGKVSDSMVDG